MKKKNIIALLALMTSLTFVVLGAGCFNATTEISSSTTESDISLESKSDVSSDSKSDVSSEDASSSEENSSSQEVHTHSLTKVGEQEATCTEDGMQAYYICDGCEKIFVDADGQTETTLDDLKIAAGHIYVEQAEEAADYFATGVKAHYTCENCDEKFLKDGDNYVVTTDEALVIAKKTIADETTESAVNTESADLINTVVADKVKQFDQTQPTYVKINNAEGQETQAIYFSRTTAWDTAADLENNCGFVEFRIPVNANCGGISFAYKMLDSNNEVCNSLSPEDKAYGMKSYIEYKMNGEYVNVSKDVVGNICFMADGEWHTFELDCNKKNVEFIIIKIYHFEGEMVVTNMQTLEAKHIHETVEVPEKVETCTEDGNTSYYTCECGKFFADAEATEEIAENSWVLPAHHTMSNTLEYNEEYHYYPCEKCDYEDKTNHTMEKVDDGQECIGVEHTACACGYAAETVIEDPTIDFTASVYGANVFSIEANTAFADRTMATTNTLKYLLYHDNNVTKALHQIGLPRIDFTKYGEVKLSVAFDSFQWDQQFGLTEDGLTNVSDTWVEAASYEGKLIFTWKNDALQMKLRICGKTLEQTITDEDIIHGKASAYFYVQAYFDRYVTLSDFVFNTADEVNPYGEQYIAGYAIISSEQYDEAKRLIGLTVEIPGGIDWWINAPVLTQDYLNALVAENLGSITIGVASTTATNNFITQYNGTPNYNANAGATIKLVKDGGDLQFGYVDLNNGGKTVATALTLTFAYSVDPQTIADEIGLSLTENANIVKDAEGVYTISNTAGYQKDVFFSAEQVNAWIEDGYDAIALKIVFTTSDNIDQIVGWSASLGYFTNETGSVEWTINLKKEEPIHFWAQKSGATAAGAFTMSNIEFKKQPSFTAGYATVSNEQYDESGRIVSFVVEIPAGLDWSKDGPLFTASYLNKLYANGIEMLSLSVASTTTTNNFITYYNNTLDYDPRDGYDIALLENGGDLKISYVDLNNGGATVATTLTITIEYKVNPQSIAGEIGLTLASGVQIEKTAEGYTLSNMSGYQGGASFSVEQVNAWIAQGHTSVSVKVAFTKGDNIDTVVGYTTATGFLTNGDGAFEWTIPLTEGQAIDFWVQKDGVVSSGAFTILQVVLN